MHVSVEDTSIFGTNVEPRLRDGVDVRFAASTAAWDRAGSRLRELHRQESGRSSISPA